MRTINADVNFCTGCQICALACSYEMKKTFNPRHAKIQIHQELIGIAKRIEFSNHCNVRIPDTCSGANSEPPCIAYCCFGALQVEKGEKHELSAINPAPSCNR